MANQHPPTGKKKKAAPKRKPSRPKITAEDVAEFLAGQEKDCRDAIGEILAKHDCSLVVSRVGDGWVPEVVSNARYARVPDGKPDDSNGQT